MGRAKIFLRVACELSDLPHIERALFPVAPRIIRALFTQYGLELTMSPEKSSLYHEELSIGDASCLELATRRVLERVAASHEPPDRYPEWLRLFPAGISPVAALSLWESSGFLQHRL